MVHLWLLTSVYIESRYYGGGPWIETFEGGKERKKRTTLFELFAILLSPLFRQFHFSGWSQNFKAGACNLSETDSLSSPSLITPPLEHYSLERRASFPLPPSLHSFSIPKTSYRIRARNHSQSSRSSQTMRRNCGMHNHSSSFGSYSRWLGWETFGILQTSCKDLGRQESLARSHQEWSVSIVSYSRVFRDADHSLSHSYPLLPFYRPSEILPGIRFSTSSNFIKISISFSYNSLLKGLFYSFSRF